MKTLYFHLFIAFFNSVCARIYMFISCTRKFDVYVKLLRINIKIFTYINIYWYSLVIFRMI